MCPLFFCCTSKKPYDYESETDHPSTPESRYSDAEPSEDESLFEKIIEKASPFGSATPSPHASIRSYTAINEPVEVPVSNALEAIQRFFSSFLRW